MEASTLTPFLGYVSAHYCTMCNTHSMFRPGFWPAVMELNTPQQGAGFQAGSAKQPNAGYSPTHVPVSFRVLSSVALDHTTACNKQTTKKPLAPDKQQQQQHGHHTVS